jgi:hypothetical protein
MDSVMKIYRVIICAVLVLSQLLCARLNILDIEPRNVELIRSYEVEYSHISFVRIYGKMYVIKQKRKNHFDKIISVVLDALTAQIAEIFDERIAHHVDIIPAGKEFPGKPFIDWPATIHTFAPGKLINGQRSPYRRMNIKQQIIGFRRDMLPWMSKHIMLRKIVALDTFVCNHDRHRANLFYDAARNIFCAIDMDSSYKYNMCATACTNFTKMMHDAKVKLRANELYALIEYKKYLEFLIQTFRPEDILEIYDYFAVKAGFVQGSPLYLSAIGEIGSNKIMIRQSYTDAQKLVGILDQFIERQKRLAG